MSAKSIHHLLFSFRQSKQLKIQGRPNPDPNKRDRICKSCPGIGQTEVSLVQFILVIFDILWLTSE